jgi:hypothetical protein
MLDRLIDEARVVEPQTDENKEHPRVERFKELCLDDINLDEDEAVWLIEGLLPAGPSFGAIVGWPKSLKSFVKQHCGLHIAAGLSYCGRAVRQGAVIYFTNEGIRGVKHRLVAMKLDLNLHHSPRSDGARSSGSNTLDAALDVMWSSVRQGKEPKATVSLGFMKDGADDGVSWE